MEKGELSFNLFCSSTAALGYNKTHIQCLHGPENLYNTPKALRKTDTEDTCKKIRYEYSKDGSIYKIIYDDDAYCGFSPNNNEGFCNKELGDHEIYTSLYMLTRYISPKHNCNLLSKLPNCGSYSSEEVEDLKTLMNALEVSHNKAYAAIKPNDACAMKVINKSYWANPLPDLKSILSQISVSE